MWREIKRDLGKGMGSVEKVRGDGGCKEVWGRCGRAYGVS